MTDDMVSPVAAEWEGMAAERRDAIIEGAEAMRVHREGLARIFAIGRAFEAMQIEAMLRSHSNNPIGKRYNDAYALLEKPVPELARINKTDRNQFIWCWQQHAALQRWWDSKAQNQRDRWNHPDAVKRHYLADHGEPKQAPPGSAKPGSPIEKWKAQVARLQEELDTMRSKNRQLARGQDNLTEGRDWTWQDNAKDIATAWYRLHPTKVVQVASEVLRLAKARTPKPRRSTVAKAVIVGISAFLLMHPAKANFLRHANDLLAKCYEDTMGSDIWCIAY